MNQSLDKLSRRQLMSGKFQILREAEALNMEGQNVIDSLPDIFFSDNKYIKVIEDRVVMNTPSCSSIEEAFDFYRNLYGIVSMSTEGTYLNPAEDDSSLVFKYAFDKKLLRRLYDEENIGCSFEEFSDSIYSYFSEDAFRINCILKEIFGGRVYMEASEENHCLYFEIAVEESLRYGIEIESLKLIQTIILYGLLDNAENEDEDILDGVRRFASEHSLYFDDSIISKSGNEAVDNEIKECDKEELVLNQKDIMKRNYDACYAERFKLIGYEDLQLSTQILMKEAIKNGIEVKVIDRSENFISLEKDGRVEYVKEATKTSVDSYVTVLIMENKVVTKKVVEKAGINVPKGYEFDSIEDAIDEIDELYNKPIVIKPKSTNFGIGISIFPEGASKEDVESALAIAFNHDKTVLVENFVKGKEYRFLVIDGKVVGILNRVPANVKGDGIKTITELVDDKNLDPLRGRGYRTPLEKINLDDNAWLFLKQRGLDFDYVPKKDEVVYLRENSNISTGGDSVDYTDDMPERFKDIAVKAAESVKAKICGVDMIIEDYKDESSNYSIIELNFNPAIHIHSYPYIGKERNIAGSVLKLLKMI